MATLFQDVRFAPRTLCANRGFAPVAVAEVALFYLVAVYGSRFTANGVSNYVSS